jgi:hypothetical protein
MRAYDVLHMRNAPGVPMMQLICFVDPALGVRYARRNGYGTLPSILAARPPLMRYSVVRVADPAVCECIWLVDMLDLRTDRDHTALNIGWYKVYDSEDAAIMAAQMRGERA